MNFQIETTSICNLTCGYCPNKDMERERKFMDRAVWTTILNKYVLPYKDVNTPAGNRPTLIPHKDGESLLNKQFLDLLQEASDTVGAGMNIDVYSHGLMLPVWRKRGKDVFEFFRSLPNRVRYLMSYHPYNHDGSVNDYTDTFAYMREVLANGPKNVEVIMVAHISKQADEQAILAWKESWVGLPVTVHANVSINPWTGLIDDPHVSKFNGCPYGDFGHWFFGVTGNLIACCLDLEEEIVFGNVMVDEPQAMFDKVQEFYRAQTRREVAYPVCNNCFGLPQAPKLQQLGVGA